MNKSIDVIANLDHLHIKYADYGGIKTCTLSKKSPAVKATSTKWRNWWDIPRNERHTVNARTILPDEIILDIDAELPQDRMIKLKKIVAALNEQKYSYEVWFTGSRGHHIHLTFPELLKLEEEGRVQARKWFIRLYDTDITKQTGVIALEGAKHFKTGNPKELTFFKHTGNENVLPTDCLTFVKKMADRVAAFQARSPTTAVRGRDGRVSKNQLKKYFYANPLVQYVMAEIVPDGTQRHNKVVRWLAVECIKAEMLDSEVEEFAKKVSPNFPNKNFGQDLQGWIVWLKNKAVQEGRVVL